MPALSSFEMYRIGVGPSSSHTMGPWLAARRFVAELPDGALPRVERVIVDLFGSLAKTGKGHGTDIAVQLGLAGYDPKTIDVDSLPAVINQIAATHQIKLGSEQHVAFDPRRDIEFHFDAVLPLHPNGLRFTVMLDDGSRIEEVFYSIGGGFVIKEHEVNETTPVTLPWPVETAAELLQHCEREGVAISTLVRRNELAWRTADELNAGLNEIRETMLHCIHRGCTTEGELPGGLNVRRRAAKTARKLLGHASADELSQFLSDVKQQPGDFQRVLDWVSCFALAVNEENAAFGRVVTAPTNGAAGVIPAVMLYYMCFCDQAEESCGDFLLTAAEIGCIFKKNATISAALGGCQAEIGVSSAMAAAALTECLGGSPRQATIAAEIAMEHHLGMTCDPIGGLVQIPCIERNAMGAIKAITAARIALQRDPTEARVSLDDVINTMWETAQDMHAKYKETSEGGLALRIPVNVSEC